MDIELNHVYKSFGSKEVLRDVSVRFEGSKINALLGENGAGKTTLANILCTYPGVFKVNQEPLLSAGISVKQNILLGTKHSRKIIYRHAEELKNKWCPDLDLNKKVSDCSGREKFFTSLIGCLVQFPQMLILDEPGRTLDWVDRRLLYSNLRQFAKTGCNIVVITHSIEEAQLYTDTITILEDGCVKAVYDDSQDFEPAMFKFSARRGGLGGTPPGDGGVSKTAEPVETRGKAFPLPPLKNSIFSVRNLSCSPRLRPSIKNFNFDVEKGKVTLISLSAENGLFTLEDVITGMTKNTVHGKLYWRTTKKQKTKLHSRNFFWRPLTARAVRNLYGKNKTSILFSEKNMRASNPMLTVEQAVSVNMPKNTKDTADFAKDIINKARINTGPQEKISSLSGGMLQKLILERELNLDSKFLILCEPLQGLDYTSTMETCRRIKALTFTGKTVLVLSSVEYPPIFVDKEYKYGGEQ